MNRVEVENITFDVSRNNGKIGVFTVKVYNLYKNAFDILQSD